MIRLSGFALASTILVTAAGLRAAEPAPVGVKQPVYISLFSRVDDPFHVEWTQERMRRLTSMVERLRQAYPQSGLSLRLDFTGASAQVFAERNGHGGLLDTVQDGVRRGWLEIGYDGTDEPTWRQRPIPNFRKAKTVEDVWLARAEAYEWFLTEYKDLFSGFPDPSRAGGLRMTQEIFGKVASIGGVELDEVGADSELVHQIRRQNTTAILPGLPEAGVWPAKKLPGIGSSPVEFSKAMSSEPECAAEVYWLDNFLRLSNTSGAPVKVIAAHGGPKVLQEMLDKLDRGRAHVIRVQLDAHEIYFKPDFNGGVLSPARYVYDNPKRPLLPEAALRPRAEVEASRKQEDELIRWLAEVYFPANAGSRFVSAADLRRMAGPPTGKEVSLQDLTSAAEYLLDDWKKSQNMMPDFARSGSNIYSLADMFVLMTSALAEKHRTGTVPKSVRQWPVYGPLDVGIDDIGPAQGSVRASAIAEACSRIAERLKSEVWEPVPGNAIPSRIQVAGLEVNAAQFLRLMSQTLLNPSATEFPLRTSLMVSGISTVLPSSRRLSESGAVWTLKPAPLKP